MFHSNKNLCSFLFIQEAIVEVETCMSKETLAFGVGGGVVINPGFLVIGCDLVLTTILEISKRPVVCQFVQR